MPHNYNLAILSPSLTNYSETFIRAHKENLAGNIFFFYGGFFPQFIDQHGSIYDITPFYKKVWAKIKSEIGSNKKYFQENILTYCLKKFKIDVVLVEYATTGSETYQVLRQLNIPFIVHFHGFDAYQHDTLEKYKQDYPKMFRDAYKLVAVSKAMVKQLEKLGAPTDKIIYNSYGPRELFQEVQCNYEAIKFVATGRFTDKKAPYLTIEAFKTVLEKIPDAQLVFAGDGELLETCTNLANCWGLSKNITFLGQQTPNQIASSYVNARAFIQHSIRTKDGNSEGTPLAVLEAQAAGLPVVSTKHAGIPDVVIHKQTGFLVDEFDVNSMAEYMLTLAQNESLARKLGQEGCIRIREHFTLDKHINTLNQTIQAALKK